MAKVAAKRLAVIEKALRNLERGMAYVHSADTAVCKRGGFATTTLHYTRADGSVLYEVERAYGSDLVALQIAKETLESFLRECREETPEVEAA